jgi:hypothetical protein
VLKISELFSDWLLFHYLPSLLVACILIGLAIAAGNAAFARRGNRTPEPHADLGIGAPSARNSIFLALGICLGLYFWLLLAWEDFSFYDAHIFYQSMAGGPQNAPLQLFPTLGRYYPLTHQEFRLLSLFGTSAQDYQVFAAVEILLGGFLLTRVYRLHPAITAAICVAILLTPPIAAAIFHLVNSERNILLLLCLFLWAALRYQQSHRTSYVVAAGVACFVMLQYKETAVPWMLAWACYVAVAARFMALPATDDRRSLAMLAGAVIVGCLVWLAVYALAILPQVQQSYLVGRQHNLFDILRMIVGQVWYWVLVGSILCRLMLARRGVHASPIWDGLALAAAVSTAAYVKLGLYHDYYFAPAAMMAWLYAGRVAELAYSRAAGDRRPALLSMVGIIALLAALQIPLAFWDVYAPWKENVASKADAARFIDAVHASRPVEQWRSPLRIVFPTNTNYEVAFFIGYLQAKYRILDLEVGLGRDNLQGGLGADRLGTSTAQCVLWIPAICVYGLPARPGDLLAYFGEEGKNLDALKAKYRLVHVSPDIGFWHNDLRAYIFMAP